MGNETLVFHPNGAVAKAIEEFGPDHPEVIGLMELLGSDAGVFAPADKCSGIIVVGKDQKDVEK